MRYVGLTGTRAAADRLTGVHRAWFTLGLLSVLLLFACRDECHRHGGRAGREAATRDNLYAIRKAIDNFYGDNRRYPVRLSDLVPNYLRRIPTDPLTHRADWIVVHDGSAVVDVRSAAKGKTCDGTEYKEL